jgi:hypothetical protein
MELPGNRPNPISGSPGQIQKGVDPKMLRPTRKDLIASRLEFQRQLLLSDQSRFTPIIVSQEGVIIDGHHAVRAAAEEGRTLDVMISTLLANARSDSILDLPLE